MERAAKSVARCALALQQVEHVGEVETIITVARLLSGNFINEDVDKDFWGIHSRTCGTLETRHFT